MMTNSLRLGDTLAIELAQCSSSSNLKEVKAPTNSEKALEDGLSNRSKKIFTEEASLSLPPITEIRVRVVETIIAEVVGIRVIIVSRVNIPIGIGLVSRGRFGLGIFILDVND